MDTINHCVKILAFLLFFMGSAVAGYFVGKRKGQPVTGVLSGLFLGPIGVFIASFAQDMRPFPGKKASEEGHSLRGVDPSDVVETGICALCGRETIGLRFPFWHCQEMRMPARYQNVPDYYHHSHYSSVNAFVCMECATRYSEPSTLPKLVGGGLIALLGFVTIIRGVICCFSDWSEANTLFLGGIMFALGGGGFVAWGLWEQRGVIRSGSKSFPKSLQNAIVANARKSSPTSDAYGVWYDTYITDAQYVANKGLDT